MRSTSNCRRSHPQESPTTVDVPAPASRAEPPTVSRLGRPLRSCRDPVVVLGVGLVAVGLANAGDPTYGLLWSTGFGIIFMLGVPARARRWSRPRSRAACSEPTSGCGGSSVSASP